MEQAREYQPSELPALGWLNIDFTNGEAIYFVLPSGAYGFCLIRHQGAPR